MRKDTKKNNLLSVIIPAYKQEKTIQKDLIRILSVMEKLRYKYEIIVVVDGMLDSTWKNAKKIKSSKLLVVGYETNKGKGYAVRFGMGRARGGIVAFIDSGMDLHPNGLSMLLEHFEWYNADIIVGSKRHPASKVKYSAIRRVLSYGYYYLVKVLFGISVRDTQAGIKIFRKPVLKKILPRLLEKKFAGDLEILVASREAGYKRIFEAPIKLDYTFEKVTSAATLTSIFGMFIDTLAIFYRAHILHYYKSNHRKFKVPDKMLVLK